MAAKQADFPSTIPRKTALRQFIPALQTVCPNSQVSSSGTRSATSFFLFCPIAIEGNTHTDLIGSAAQTSLIPRHELAAARSEAPAADTDIKDKSKVFVRLVATSFPRLPGYVSCAAPAPTHTTQTHHVLFFFSLSSPLMPPPLCHHFYPSPPKKIQFEPLE